MKSTKDIIKIIKSGITSNSADIKQLTADEDFLEVVHKHRIQTMAYYGLLNSNIELKDDIKKYLQAQAYIDLLISEKQIYLFDTICRAFEENQISYLPLKGIKLKKLYPSPEIRRMGDIDILIKREQYETIAEVMKDLGFEGGKETGHEFLWRKDNILVELHYRMLPVYNKDFYRYFDNIWDRAIKETQYKYTLSTNDTFIFLFVHFSKHYRDSGIGIIHVCDLWLYIKSCKLNFSYIEKELESLGLYDFWKNICKLLEVWFENGTADEKTEYITNVVFKSGVYGNPENTAISQSLKRKNHIENKCIRNIHYAVKLVFPGLDGMKRRHNTLKRFPFLLPLFWVVRWCDILLNKNRKLKEDIMQYSNISDDIVDEYEKNLAYVGLKYNFK